MENKELNHSQNEINKEDKTNNEEVNLEEYLINLIKDKDLLASQGKYLEAENIRKKISDIKNNTMYQNKKDLETRHFDEMKQLEESFNNEIKAVNDFWDQEFSNFQSNYTELTNTMEEKHKKELTNLKEFIDDKFNKNFKFSKEYLDLKTSEMNMVKQERYVEAHKIKQRCDYLEKIEVERHMKLKNENYSLKSENLIKQQTVEKNALTQRMNSEYEEMAKVKQIELDKIVTKFKNKKFELETRQAKEKNIHDNENLLKANIFNSNLVNFSNNETIQNSINKSMKKPSKKLFTISDAKLKEIRTTSKKNISKVADSLNSNEKKFGESYVSNANGSYEKNSNKGIGIMNKSAKLFNIGNTGSMKQKPTFVSNLQYSSAQN